MALTLQHQPAARPDPGAVLGFACVRDERARVEWFLHHQRQLGVDGFCIVDNASTDGTPEWLATQPDVTLYHTDESYAAAACGIDWLNTLLDRHGQGHWTLTLDADEQLVYPGAERFGLPLLTAHLEAQGADALLTVMLDMYSDRPIGETRYRRGMPFLDACPFFDGEGYGFLAPHAAFEGPALRGGVRERVFWRGRARERPSPFLGKIPLVRWGPGKRLEASTHRVAGVRLAHETGVLLHFKYFDDFVTRVPYEVERGEHFDAASQYRAYQELLDERHDLSLHYEGSVRYRSSAQLVELGFMRSCPSLDAWRQVPSPTRAPSGR
ncbi:MAG: glycosyltransferase family 2 protein [Planctomycetota bacterium]|jgi:hypothetical protein